MTDHDPAMERARKRAEVLKEFYGHLVMYILVCGMLVVIDLATSSGSAKFIGLNWAYWPIFGWGIAIVIHAVSVFIPLSGWEERKVQQLYEKEQRRHLGQN